MTLIAVITPAKSPVASTRAQFHNAVMAIAAIEAIESCHPVKLAPITMLKKIAVLTACAESDPPRETHKYDHP